LTLRAVHLSLALSACLAAAHPLSAQNGVPGASFESRAQLDSAARAAESQGRNAEAFLLRSRLNKGDFQEGDRIVVALANSSKPDTLVVRAGRVLRFPGMNDLALGGVLRSELTESVRRHLARYLVDPDVRIQTLFAVTVVGNIGAPGFYYTSPDVVLRDVLMRAGGPRDADLNRVTIRRAGETIWQAADVASRSPTDCRSTSCTFAPATRSSSQRADAAFPRRQS